MKLAVCIPCVNGHLPLLIHSLKFVQAQTRAPDLIVISISSCLVNHGLDISGSAIPTTVITTPKKLFAGANRNIAAAEAVKQGATHLSFFDADDLMHPQRLECIEHAFNTTPDLTGLIHSYLVAQKKDMAIYKGEKEIPWEPILKDFAPNVFQAGQYNKINIIKRHFSV